MINQIQNSSYSSVFTPLQSSSVPYAIVKPSFKNPSQVQEDSVKEKKNKHLGKIIVSSGVAVGIGLLIASRIFSKKSNLNINKYGQKLDEKISKLKDSKTLSFLQRGYYNVLRAEKFAVNHSKSVFMIATLKDISFKKAFTKIPGLNKLGEAITNFFERVSVKTVDLHYKGTNFLFDKMFAKMRGAKKYLSKSEAEQLENLISVAENDYLSGFSKSARDKRLESASENMKGLFDNVWGHTIGKLTGGKFGDIVKSLKNEKTYTKFLAEDQAAEAKMALNSSINACKTKITVSNKNRISVIKDLVSNIDTYINPTDPESVKLVKRLRADLKTFKDGMLAEDSANACDTALINSVIRDLSQLGSHIEKSDVYNPEITKTIQTSIEGLTSTLHDSKQGSIQQIMEKLKANMPEEEYKKLNKTVNKSLSSLDKSTDLEGDKLFDKLRDLSLGSAIHDTVALLGSVGAVGWYVGKSDTSDERISAALKYGIPTVASVAITATCTFGLIASGPSLLIGLGSGVLINRIGKYIDNKRKEIKEKPIEKSIKEKVENIKQDIKA